MHITPERGINSDKEYTSKIVPVEELSGWWPEVEPLVMRGLEPSQGELLPGDILLALLQNRMTLFIATLDGKVQMAMVVEMVYYPQYTVARPVVLAGEDLKRALVFLPAFEKWAITLGATYIEAWVQEPQRRLYQRRNLGFTPVYTVVRKPLKGALQ